MLHNLLQRDHSLLYCIPAHKECISASWKISHFDSIKIYGLMFEPTRDLNYFCQKTKTSHDEYDAQVQDTPSWHTEIRPLVPRSLTESSVSVIRSPNSRLLLACLSRRPRSAGISEWSCFLAAATARPAGPVVEQGQRPVTRGTVRKDVRSPIWQYCRSARPRTVSWTGVRLHVPEEAGPRVGWGS
jgi:hypothetical protein